MNNLDKLKKLCRLIRYDIITSTTAAGSGHPTTALSAVELMTTLMFGGFFQQDLKNPKALYNDRLIFSKGHASPLLYALYHTAGVLSFKEILSLRQFGSPLEGHPVPRFEFVDVATGSLGQGLSVGVGMALGIKLRIKNLELRIKREPRVWVLLGDSEVAEGQIWEAMEISAYYKLNNLIGILDVNRLGQRGETMLGWDIKTYKKRISSFGWKTIVIDDGHDLRKVYEAYKKTTYPYFLGPTMIIAKTIKGKCVSFLENKDGWHGKPVPKERLNEAIKELGKVNLKIRGKITIPKSQSSEVKSQFVDKKVKSNYTLQDLVATREAYGDALVKFGQYYKDILVLDAEVSNSTYADKFKAVFPDRFFEMFLGEQNMIDVALGLSPKGFTVFASTFAGFLSRAFDQIRMCQYSQANLKIVQSHTGVSIGADGPSQMALEDIAMMRSILNSVVLYPSDAVSTIKITELMHRYEGVSYLRLTREKTPVIYNNQEEFKVGGCKIHYIKNQIPACRQARSKIKNTYQKSKRKILIISAGITLHEALKAQKELTKENIETVVVDLYSVKPIDSQTICRLAKEIKNIIIVEDHYPAGGLGEAVANVILGRSPATTGRRLQNLDNDSGQARMTRGINFVHLCVRKLPRSGTPEELLNFEEINAAAIIEKVKEIVK